MVMKKQSNKGIPCTYCDEKALPNTDPPVCAKHRGMRKQAAKGMTLKELESKRVSKEM